MKCALLAWLSCMGTSHHLIFADKNLDYSVLLKDMVLYFSTFVQQNLLAIVSRWAGRKLK